MNMVILSCQIFVTVAFLQYCADFFFLHMFIAKSTQRRLVSLARVTGYTLLPKWTVTVYVSTTALYLITLETAVRKVCFPLCEQQTLSTGQFI